MIRTVYYYAIVSPGEHCFETSVTTNPEHDESKFLFDVGRCCGSLRSAKALLQDIAPLGAKLQWVHGYIDGEPWIETWTADIVA